MEVHPSLQLHGGKGDTDPLPYPYHHYRFMILYHNEPPKVSHLLLVVRNHQLLLYAGNKTTRRSAALDIHPSIEMKEPLTCDAGLGDSGRRLCGAKLTLPGGKSDLSGIKVEL